MPLLITAFSVREDADSPAQSAHAPCQLKTQEIHHQMPSFERETVLRW
jgi:hypothetical protein